jgi:hypothetical protein
MSAYTLKRQTPSIAIITGDDTQAIAGMKTTMVQLGGKINEDFQEEGIIESSFDRQPKEEELTVEAQLQEIGDSKMRLEVTGFLSGSLDLSGEARKKAIEVINQFFILSKLGSQES